MHGGLIIPILSGFSLEMMDTIRYDILKVLKQKKDYHPNILYTADLVFQNEGIKEVILRLKSD
jgi:hypothetical protein